MESFLDKYSPVAYALLRLVAGLMFFCHGAAHLFGLFDPEMKAPLGSLPGVGGLIELVCGVFVAFGLLGGGAAFLASGEMAVAYFLFHAKGGFFPIANHGELAVLYCFVFLYIACRGSGPLSVDELFVRARRERASGGRARV